METDAKISEIIPAIRALLSRPGFIPVIKYVREDSVKTFADSREKFEKSLDGIDNIYLPGGDPETIIKSFIEVQANTDFNLGLIMIKGTGLLGIGRSLEEASYFISELLKGSTVPEHDENGMNGRIQNKIFIVTGGAMGFGQGITEELVNEGGYVVIADINPQAGEKTAGEINHRSGRKRVAFVQCDITDPGSVKNLVSETIREFGGLDALISNAGVLIAGPVEEFEEKTFDFITGVNYKGLFICTKYCVPVMKLQYRYNPSMFMDIIQINSKSGLAGSNKNFAYSGSKFGSIGLVQSFALELAPYHIKVNAVCPGNYFEGPLWSDPQKGLFAQYLEAGKVPGAQNIGDVKKFYESKVPMGRGCTPGDVVKAIYYLIEQEYETGQAVPVTGGQIMLH